MLINATDVSSIRKQFEIEVPADAVKQELRKVTTEFARQARIPGFRPGKTPEHVVRSRFQKDIEKEVIERVLPKYFHEAAAEKGYVPVGEPWLKKVGDLVEGEPLRFETEFEIRPTIELREFRGIELTPPTGLVTEVDVDDAIDKLREQASTYRLIDDRAAGDNDYVVFDLTTSGENFEGGTSEGAHVRIGEETPFPELHAALRDKRPGDQLSVEKAWGEDAHDESLRGKNIRYDITVKELRQKDLPEVDDAFAVSLGLTDADELRQRIRTDLEHRRNHETHRAKREQAAERLLELHTFDVPETLVEDELGNSLRNYARYLTSQGVDLEKADIDWEKVREEFQPEAVKRVQRQLILDEVARSEKLIVTDAEVDVEIRRGAAETKQEFAELKHRLRHDGGYESLRASMLQDRALDFVVAEGRVL